MEPACRYRPGLVKPGAEFWRVLDYSGMNHRSCLVPAYRLKSSFCRSAPNFLIGRPGAEAAVRRISAMSGTTGKVLRVPPIRCQEFPVGQPGRQ